MGLDAMLYRVVSYDHDKVKKIKASLPGIEDGGILQGEKEVGYWRKFNALHGYMQKKYLGEDDNCRRAYLYKDDLKDILKLCKKVKLKAELVEDWVRWGERSEGIKDNKDRYAGKKIGDEIDLPLTPFDDPHRKNKFILTGVKDGVATTQHLVWGKRANNPEACEKLLPVKEGFFFGSYDYDEYYFEQIDKTIEIIEKLLKEDVQLRHDDRVADIEYYYYASY